MQPIKIFLLVLFVPNNCSRLLTRPCLYVCYRRPAAGSPDTLTSASRTRGTSGPRSSVCPAPATAPTPSSTAPPSRSGSWPADCRRAAYDLAPRRQRHYCDSRNTHYQASSLRCDVGWLTSRYYSPWPTGTGKKQLQVYSCSLFPG